MPRRKTDPLDQALDAYTALDVETRRGFRQFIDYLDRFENSSQPELFSAARKPRKQRGPVDLLTAGEKAG